MDIDKEREDFEKCFRDWALKSVGIVFTQDDMISKRGINGNYDSTKHVHDLWTGWKWKASRKENLSEENDMNIENQRAAFEVELRDRNNLAASYEFSKYKDGTYISPSQQDCWVYWQAAIELDRQGRGEAVALSQALKFAEHVRKCLRQNGEYAPLITQDVDEMIAVCRAALEAQQPTEPAKVPSDMEVAKLAARWGISSDGRGIKAHTNIMGFVHEALSIYGGANHET